MMDREIPLFEIAWDDREVSNAVESISRGSYWAKGPFVSEFEARLESALGVEHAVTVNSGTTALVAALAAHGIGPGDEVIVPSFTFIATANAVELVGATPVFADIERETFGLDPSSVRERISEATAAILPVHCYGTACRIAELVEIAREHDLVVIEDAAEALGSEHRNQLVGTFGDSAALSFCQNKIVATGEGGAVVTDDDEIAEKLRLYRSHGRSSSNYFDSVGSGTYVALGTNIRMPDVVASIGCAQLSKMDELISGRRRVARKLNEGFDDVDGVTPFRGSPEATHVYQLYTVLFDPDVDRTTVTETLSERGVSSKVYWDPPVHRTAFYRQKDGGGATRLPVTDEIASRVLSLPMHPGLDSLEIARVVDGVQAGLNGT